MTAQITTKSIFTGAGDFLILEIESLECFDLTHKWRDGELELEDDYCGSIKVAGGEMSVEWDGDAPFCFEDEQEEVERKIVDAYYEWLHECQRDLGLKLGLIH